MPATRRSGAVVSRYVGAIIVLSVCSVISRSVNGGTVISMPSPPKKAAAPMVETSVTPESDAYGSAAAPASAMTSAVQSEVTVGDVALYRYSGARWGTYATYSSDGSYMSNGIRVYSYPRYYPQWVWGPFWGWGFWGFPFCH